MPKDVGTKTDCTCFICLPAETDFLSEEKQPGVPKSEFSNTLSRDNRSLDESRRYDVSELMATLTPKTKDFLVKARIEEKQAEKSTNSPLKFTSATGGKPMEVIAGCKAKKRLYDKNAPVTTKTFENIARGTDMSANKLSAVAKEFRKSQGRNSIEPGMKEQIQDAPLVLKKYFTTVYIPLEVKNKETKQVEKATVKVVYCHDLKGYKDHLKQERGIVGEVDVKVGIDGGKDFSNFV